MSVSKISFMRKTGKLLVSAVMLSSLLIAGCSSPNSTPTANPDNPQPQPPSSAVTGLVDFQSAYFDAAKQVSVELPPSDSKNVILPNGIVVQKEENNAFNLTLIPFIDQTKKWTVPLDFTPNDRILMRWKGKSYVVAAGTVTTTIPASGLTAEKKTDTQKVVVIDPETGKIVSTLSDDAMSLELPDRYGMSAANNTAENVLFTVGLLFKKDNLYLLIDPLTKETIATLNSDTDSLDLYNEAGFYSLRDVVSLSNPYGETRLHRVVGNYVLVSEPQADITSKAGGPNLRTATYSIIDTVQKKKVAEYLGSNASGPSPELAHSPNFQYLAFGQVILDTKTGEIFDSNPFNSDPSRRSSNVKLLDDAGNIYLTAERGMLKISISDTTKVETIMTSEENKETFRSPILFTGNGEAVFHSDMSQEMLVTVPVK